MTLDFDDWSQLELLSLFCSGCIMELIEEHKLGFTSILSFPVLTSEGMTMYYELLETGWYPEKADVKRFVKYLRAISFRDVPKQSYLLQ